MGWMAGRPLSRWGGGTRLVWGERFCGCDYGAGSVWAAAGAAGDAHVVVIMEENFSYDDAIGNAGAP
jgi:hypothetical protein